MSLEQNIEALNTNIVALINALQSMAGAAGQDVPVVPVVVERVMPITAAPERPSKVAEQQADAPAPLVSFEDVKRAVLALATRDRKAAVDLLAKHKAKRITDLPESLYTAVEFEARALLGE